MNGPDIDRSRNKTSTEKCGNTDGLTFVEFRSDHTEKVLHPTFRGQVKGHEAVAAF